MSYDPRPPEVIAAAITIERWLNQPPVRVTDEQFAKMSARERIDYARRWPQTLESGRKT
jgi:hypothetical protein